MNKIEEYWMRKRLLKENGETDATLYGATIYKNRKKAKITNEYYEKIGARKNEKGETSMFFGNNVIHFVDRTSYC